MTTEQDFGTEETLTRRKSGEHIINGLVMMMKIRHHLSLGVDSDHWSGVIWDEYCSWR